MTKENRLPAGENKMRVMPVGKLLITMALPLALSMIVQAFYNIVDTYFVSLVDTDATGALSFAFPIQNLQIGFATGIGVGMNSLLSKSLGEGNRERANKAAGNGILLMLAAIALFMLFGEVNGGWLGFEGALVAKVPRILYRNYFTAALGFPQPGFFSTDYFSLLPWF